MFAWLGTTPSPTVTLKVKIKGMEFTQKAFFQVKKPPVQPLPHKNGTINASPTVATPDDVQLYRIDDFSGRHRGGYLATAVGQDESIGWDDMHFFHKIVSSLREARDSSGDIIQAHYWNITNKHDGSAVPYDLVAEIRMNLYGTTRSSFSPPSTEPARRGKIMEDSPVQPIYEAAFRTEVDDRFEVWLMHKAGAYTSTWVPIAKGNWFWHFVYWKGANNIGSFSEKEWDVSVLAQTDDFPIWSGTFDAPRRPVQ
jgi:hypothetical protein